MNHRRRPAVLLLCALVLVLAACGSGKAAESKALIPRDPGNLNGTDWVLVGTGDSDAVPASTPLSLRIENDTASGNGPCNRYHLAFAHHSNDVTTGPVLSTQIACFPPELAAAEHKFFQALEAVDTAEMESGHLVLSGSGDVRLVFERAGEPADKIVGKWRIVNVATANALKTVLTGSKPTVDFASGGALTVEPGCNLGHSTWRAQDRTIAIAPPGATKKLCTAPVGIMDQEASILAALPRSTTVDVSHDQAQLLDAAGTMLLVLARDS